MANRAIIIFLALLLIASQTFNFATASMRKVHIPDELDDVFDDEEDEEWREWGRKTKVQPDFDPPPTDFSGMEIQEMQEEMIKRQLGPVFGFVKLRAGARRTPEMVAEIAMKWTKIARTGSIEAKFSGVDASTIMFTMERGQDTLELKEFLLSQSEAYEIKIGDLLFRRPGDPSFEEVFDKLQLETRSASDASNPAKDEKHTEL